MIVKLSDRVEVEWFEQVGPDRQPKENEISVSDVGSIAAARVVPRDPEDGEAVHCGFHVRALEPDGQSHEDSTQHHFRPVRTDGPGTVPFSDRVLAAGDLNDWHGAGAYSDMRSVDPVETVSDRFGYLYRIHSEGDRYTVVIRRPNGDAFRIERKRWKTLWGARRWVERNMEAFEDLRRRVTSGETRLEPGVWSRMNSLGLEFMGPQYPNGRTGKIPYPSSCHRIPQNVVTFHLPGQAAGDADQQLDYVFASRGFHESVTTRALNSVDEWGSSDHCRNLIEVTG